MHFSGGLLLRALPPPHSPPRSLVYFFHYFPIMHSFFFSLVLSLPLYFYIFETLSICLSLPPTPCGAAVHAMVYPWEAALCLPPSAWQRRTRRAPPPAPAVCNKLEAAWRQVEQGAGSPRVQLLEERVETRVDGCVSCDKSEAVCHAQSRGERRRGLQRLLMAVKPRMGLLWHSVLPHQYCPLLFFFSPDYWCVCVCVCVCVRISLALLFQLLCASLALIPPVVLLISLSPVLLS